MAAPPPPSPTTQPPTLTPPAERPVLDEEAIERNVAGIERTLRRLLVAPPGSGWAEPLVLNNLDWFGPMGFLQFLREIGEAGGRARARAGWQAGGLAGRQANSCLHRAAHARQPFDGLPSAPAARPLAIHHPPRHHHHARTPLCARRRQVCARGHDDSQGERAASHRERVWHLFHRIHLSAAPGEWGGSVCCLRVRVRGLGQRWEVGGKQRARVGEARPREPARPSALGCARCMHASRTRRPHPPFHALPCPPTPSPPRAPAPAAQAGL